MQHLFYIIIENKQETNAFVIQQLFVVDFDTSQISNTVNTFQGRFPHPVFKKSVKLWKHTSLKKMIIIEKSFFNIHNVCKWCWIDIKTTLCSLFQHPSDGYKFKWYIEWTSKKRLFPSRELWVIFYLELFWEYVFVGLSRI